MFKLNSVIFAISIFGFLTIFSHNVFAKNIKITTLGSHDCLNWNTAKIDAERIPTKSTSWLNRSLARQWVLGYASANNEIYSTDTDMFASVDAETIFSWVDQYCSKNAHEDVRIAIHKLFIELTKIKRK